MTTGTCAISDAQLLQALVRHRELPQDIVAVRPHLYAEPPQHRHPPQLRQHVRRGLLVVRHLVTTIALLFNFQLESTTIFVPVRPMSPRLSAATDAAVDKSLLTNTADPAVTRLKTLPRENYGRR